MRLNFFARSIARSIYLALFLEQKRKVLDSHRGLWGITNEEFVASRIFLFPTARSSSISREDGSARRGNAVLRKHLRD